jgi:chromosome partitioning protein
VESSINGPWLGNVTPVKVPPRKYFVFHVKHLALMLDVRVRAGEYEALAPFRLEEKIMRGRRRGRNRPSPAGPSLSGSAETPSPQSRGTVKVLDASNDDNERQEESSSTKSTSGGAEVKEAVRLSGAAVDSPTGNSADLSPIESKGGPVDRSLDVDDSPEGTSHADTSTPEEPAVVAPAVKGTVAAATETPDRVEVASEEPAASVTEEVGKVTPATNAAGRQPQAASGNPLPRILAVANQKGGVGKTTTSVNLGAALAELGFRVLVIDLDPQGNATTGLGIDARNFELSMYDVLMRDSSLEDCVEPTSMKNLFVAPATIALAGAEIELVPAFSRELKLKRAIESVIDDFDYVLIDCPPSLGLITVNALAAADEVLVPIQCEYYALEGLSQLMRNVHLVASNLNPRLDISTIVLTMYDARTKLSDQVATEVREHFGNKVCRIVIPRTVRLSEAPSFGQPITAFDPVSRGAIAYRELAKEVSGGTS